MKFTSKFSESKNFFINAVRLLLYTLYFIPYTLFSQPGTWVAVYGGTNYDRGTGISQTSDKGYIVCGATSSYGMGNTDMYLLKINSAGKFQWHTTFGGINNENCFSVKQTSDSGFIICGYTNSFGAGGYDAYLVKADSVGNLQWQKTYGGKNWDFAYWTEQTNDGGYILAGETYSYENNSRAYLVKTNNKGDTLWTKTFGGTNATDAKEVHQTADNGYVFAGSTQTGPGNKDFYLVKTSSNGDTLWTKTYGSTGNDFCNSVALCADGGFLLGGLYDSSGTSKTYFIKTNSSGNAMFSKIEMPSTGNRYITRIRETFDGQYILLENTDAGGLGGKEIRIDKYNTGGWAQFNGSLGGIYDDEGYDLVQTVDSGFALVGFTSSFSIGSDNIFIAKTNNTLNYNNTVNSYVSVNEISETKENTLIYPNPFSEDLFLKIDRSFFSEEKNFVFEISDLCGRKIMSMEKSMSFHFSEPVQIEIPTEKFTKGVYVASLQSGNKKIYRKLLFVK